MIRMGSEPFATTIISNHNGLKRERDTTFLDLQIKLIVHVPQQVTRFSNYASSKSKLTADMQTVDNLRAVNHICLIRFLRSIKLCQLILLQVLLRIVQLY